MHDDEIITISMPNQDIDDWQTTWGEFFADNADDPDTLADIAEQIAANNYATIGGGAVPVTWIFA